MEINIKIKPHAQIWLNYILFDSNVEWYKNIKYACRNNDGLILSNIISIDSNQTQNKWVARIKKTTTNKIHCDALLGYSSFTCIQSHKNTFFQIYNLHFNLFFSSLIFTCSLSHSFSPTSPTIFRWKTNFYIYLKLFILQPKRRGVVVLI